MSAQLSGAPTLNDERWRRAVRADAKHYAWVAAGVSTIMILIALIIGTLLAGATQPTPPSTPVTITSTTTDRFGGSYALGQLPTGENVLVDGVALAGQTVDLWADGDTVAGPTAEPVYSGTPPRNDPYLYATIGKTFLTSLAFAVIASVLWFLLRFRADLRAFFPAHDHRDVASDVPTGSST